MKRLWQHKEKLGAWVIIPFALVVGTTSSYLPKLFSWADAPQSAQVVLAHPEGKGTIYFTPAGGIKLSNGKILLNDMKDYKDPRCVTLVVDPPVYPTGAEVKDFLGKTLRAKVYRAAYNGKTQLVAEKIEGIQ